MVSTLSPLPPCLSLLPRGVVGGAYRLCSTDCGVSYWFFLHGGADPLGQTVNVTLLVVEK